MMNKLLVRIVQLIRLVMARCGIMQETSNYRQNTQLFKELVLYISQQGQKYASFGKVHLNKVLYAADFEYYYNVGYPITGAAYKNERFGPIPFCMKPILDEMCDQGEIELQPLTYFGKPQMKPKARRDPNMDLIPTDVKILVDKWIAELGQLNATEVIDKFHDRPYRGVLNIGDEIPYHSVFWNDAQNQAPISEKDRERAKRFFENHKGGEISPSSS